MQTVVQQRGIQHLFHFTRLPNLRGILENGIIPRQQLAQQRMPFIFNDHVRADRRTHASCLSVSSPNYKMFFQARLNNPTDDWVVLRLNPSILWEKYCLFCETNAARGQVAATIEQQLRGRAALERMFSENNEQISRAQLGLNACEPTDVQAEVLVVGVIEPGYIVDINVEDKHRTKNFEAILALSQKFSGFSWRHGQEFFYPRHDYKKLKEVCNG